MNADLLEMVMEAILTVWLCVVAPAFIATFVGIGIWDYIASWKNK